MTPNISQHVIPRRRPRSPARNQWLAVSRFRRAAASGRWAAGLPARQRGSINSAALGVALGVIGIMAVAALSFVYLGQVLTTASQGTNVQDLEKSISELRQKQQQLELEGASLRSIQTVEQRVQQLNLTTADKVTYLTVPDRKVAAR